MVSDVECGAQAENWDPEAGGRAKQPFLKEQPSIAECWRWLKGLLYDFINLKKASYKLEADVEKSQTLNRQLNLQIAKARSSDARAALSGARGQKSSRGPKTARHHQTTEP